MEWSTNGGDGGDAGNGGAPGGGCGALSEDPSGTPGKSGQGAHVICSYYEFSWACSDGQPSPHAPIPDPTPIPTPDIPKGNPIAGCGITLSVESGGTVTEDDPNYSGSIGRGRNLYAHRQSLELYLKKPGFSRQIYIQSVTAITCQDDRLVFWVNKGPNGNIIGFPAPGTYDLYITNGPCDFTVPNAITVNPCAPPSNNNCSGASTIACGQTVSGALTRCATNSGIGSCGQGFPDVWYTMVVPYTGTIVQASFSHGSTAGTVAIYTGSACNSLTERACNVSISYSTPAVASFTTTANNQRLWFKISASYYSSQSLTINCTVPCITGSACSCPQAASCSSVFSYENQIPGTGSDTLPCYGGSGLRSRWLEISVPAETKLTVQVNETDTCILGIGFYSACGNLANPLAQICGYEDISLSYENSASSPVTLKVLVNDHPAANHPTITFACESLPPCYPGQSIACPVQVTCGAVYDGENHMGAAGTDAISCFSVVYPEHTPAGHWGEITVPANHTLRVEVLNCDFLAPVAIGIFAGPTDFPNDPLIQTCDNDYCQRECTCADLEWHNASSLPQTVLVLVNYYESLIHPTITFTCTAQNNDECAEASAISCGNVLQGQLLLNATASTPAASCGSGVPDLWYYVDVPLCGTGINAYYEAGGQAFVAIYTGTDCNNLVERMCSATQYDYRKYYACYPTEENNVRVYIRIGTTDTSGTQKLTLSCFDKLDSMAGCQR